MRAPVSLFLSLLLCGASIVCAADFDMRTSCVQIGSKSSTSLSLAFDLSQVEQQTTDQNGVDRESFVIQGEGFTYVKGMPILPAVSRLVVVPAGAGLALHIDADTPRQLRATNGPVICDDEDLADPPITSLSTGPGGLYPANIAEMSEPMVIRGVRLVRVTTYPVQYDPSTGNYICHERIDAEIEFTNDEPINPAFHPERRNRSKVFLKFINGLALNGADVGRDDPDYDRDPEYVGHYLIVLPANLVQYAGEFIEWRRRGGYKVDILVIADNQLGSADQIKARIRERYDAYLNQGIDPFDNILLIGDHATYDNCGSFGVGTQLASPQGRPIWGGHAHYDWDYGNMEGNDDFAEVGVSRFIAGDQQSMALFVGRTLSYERNPRFDRTEWFNRAATYAQKWAQNWHISLPANARWAHEVMEKVGFTDVRFREEMERMESSGEYVGPFLTEQFNAGVSVMAGRAENYNYRSSFPPNANVGVYPIDLNVAGHHEWSCWWMLRTPGDNQAMKGPCAATTGWGGQQTLPYSVIWMEMVNGFMLRDLPYGWSRIQGLIAPTTYIPNFFGTYPQVTTDVVYYGDPGIQPWVGVPKVVTVELPEVVTPRTRNVSVRVLDQNDQPVEGATVTVYAPGTIPAFNHQNYPAYRDLQMWTKESDADGNATFVFEEGTRFVTNTRMYFTVTGRKIKPFLGDRTIQTPNAILEVGAWELMDEQGQNGDGIPNPGESFSLSLTARNLGNQDDLTDVFAVVSSSSPWLLLDAQEVNFGNVPAGEEVQAQSGVTFTLSSSCPDGVSRPAQRPIIDVVFHSGDLEWQSSIILEPHSPHFEVRSVPGGIIIPINATEKDIEIVNVGSYTSANATARLVNAGMGITVVGSEGHYPSLAPGRAGRLLNNERYMLSGNRVVVPGWKNQMWLIVEDDNGFIDTVTFILQVLEPRARAPQGPDAFGYICFDDTDTDWDMAPEYAWVEIDPRANDGDFEGTRINFTGQSPYDIGEARGVRLPFETQFYGILYNRISVATNGFISFGNQDTITNFQNWPLDRAIGGGVGMLAPLWDQLKLDQNGQVYYYYDEADSRFIIEWSRLRSYTGGNVDLTFQVILYDHDVWITETGDQNIVFQYKSIADVQGNGGWANEVPYASVGISSPHGNTGINYSFNNIRPVTSAPLENRRALLFSTSPRFKAGCLYGRVTDSQTGWPIEQAVVFTEHGFVAYSDANGDWRIPEALATVPFTIYCHKQGFNDSTYTDLTVDENDSLEINFDLLHPEFTITHDFLGSNLETGQNIDLGFSLTNTGNGPMDWNAEKRLLDDANAEPWEIRRRYNVGEITDDDRIEGVIFAQDKFFLSGANDIDSANLIYVLDREGELLNRFEQIGSSRYGYKDMDWDGNYIWAAGEDTIYCLTTDGMVVTSWPDPLSPSQYIAYNSEEGILYLCGTTTQNIVRCDLEGHLLEGGLSRRSLRMYGLGYWPEDPDGYDLYIVNHPAGAPSNVTKMNVATGDTMFVFEIPQDSSSNGQQSAWITNEFDVYSWVFMSIQNLSAVGGRDRVEIHQLDARKDWMNLDIWTGRLETGETQDFTLSLNATNLPDTLFEGEILFRHNADDGEMLLAIELDVLGPLPPEPFALMYPEDGDTLTALPLHGDTLRLPAVTFAWLPSHDPNDLDFVDYEFTIETGDTSVSFETVDTTLTLSLDALALPIWFDRPIRWFVTARSGDDNVSCLRTFIINILPNDIDREKLEIPVEFGLGPVYPNPFNSRTTIRFGIDKAAPATLRIYDLTGRVVADLYSGQATVGYHRVSYDGVALPSGIYWLRLESLGRTQIEKIALIR